MRNKEELIEALQEIMGSDKLDNDEIDIIDEAIQTIQEHYPEDAATENIVSATFRSIWDDGASVIDTPCKVNLDTKEVFDIEMSAPENVDILDAEKVIINDEEYDVYEGDNSEKGDDDFWY